MKIDLIVDLQYGDCGKGRECYSRLKNNKYDYVLRYGGSANAGHTFYHNGIKTITHMLPMGVVFGVKSLIGPGCLLNPKSFFEEVEELEKLHNIDRNLIKISDRVHIITDKHLALDAKDEKIGTTKRGVGPCASDKYARTGIIAKDIPELKPFLIDFVEEIHENIPSYSRLLGEGAQGVFLDLHFAKYPYCTSTHCSTGAALINGLNWRDLDKVIGVIKPYQTYVGGQQMEKSSPIFDEIVRLGKEFGSTTGRKRQAFLLNPRQLRQATKICGITELVVNKMDILRELDYWYIGDGISKVNLKTEENFKGYIEELVKVPVSYNYSPIVN